jgi:hypothetical protein
VLTGRGTFQKFFEQGSSRRTSKSSCRQRRSLLRSASSTCSRTNPGFSSSSPTGTNRRPIAPRRRLAELRFEESRELLEPLIEKLFELGRIRTPRSALGRMRSSNGSAP